MRSITTDPDDPREAGVARRPPLRSPQPPPMESPPEAWTALNGGPISPSTNSDDMVTDGGLGEAHADEEVLLVTRADGIGRKETNLIVPPAMSDPRSQENEEAKGVASAAAGKRRGPGTGPNEAHNRRGTPVKPTHFRCEGTLQHPQLCEFPMY